MFFRRFQTRLLVFFVVLLATLQLLIFLSVNNANIRNARSVINDSLEVGASIFQRLLSQRTQTLFQHARLLSADYGFKPAFYSNDHATILSAMNNHLGRLQEADIMLLVDLDGNIIANTNHPEQKNIAVMWPELIARAEKNDYAEATGVVMIDQMPFQIIVVPYLSPDIDAWILIGFAIDQRVANDLKKMVNSEISFIVVDKNNHWRLTSSTLNRQTRDALLKQIQQRESFTDQSQTFHLAEQNFISLYTAVSSDGNVVALLQRSLDDALKPYLQLQQTLKIFFALALLLSIIGALAIARRVTRPVKELTAGAEKIRRGDYQARIATHQHDEIGVLANSFNQMAEGLAEKEKVRSLLGKVMSAEIATELLSKTIELGGEEKPATILFSDIRDFTHLCEGFEPQQILSMLNIYLTTMSDIIEINQGVIDKYIGDAIMAIFGAPVVHGDDANNAVKTSLVMTQALNTINRQQLDIFPPIKIGIGLNTDIVVAGNMGSPNRLNYTVIGDGVNLASRLESLTKFYGVPILVSESTKQAANLFAYQEIDRVKVKGKNTAAAIFRPIALKSAVSEIESRIIQLTDDLLVAYRNRDWQTAINVLAQLAPLDRSEFCAIYRSRIAALQNVPPPQDWDLTFTFNEK